MTANGQSLTYTGSAAAADSSMVTGLIGTDAATVTSATYTYTGTGGTTYGPSTTRPTAVGTYSVTPSAATLNFSSGSASNYSTPYTYVAGALTISKATLTVTANSLIVAYPASVPAGSSTVSGLQGTDAATVTSATYTYTGTGATTYGPSTTRPTNAGTYSITPSAATLNFTSGNASNYNATYTYVAGTLTIYQYTGWSGSGTSPVTSSSVSAPNDPTLIVIDYSYNGGTAPTCATPTISGTWAQAPTVFEAAATWRTGSRHYGSCAFVAAKGTGTAGTVTETFTGGATIVQATIQVIAIQGDANATFTLPTENNTTALTPDGSPVFNVGGTLTSGAYEVQYGMLTSDPGNNSGRPADVDRGCRLLHRERTISGDGSGSYHRRSLHREPRDRQQHCDGVDELLGGRPTASRWFRDDLRHFDATARDDRLPVRGLSVRADGAGELVGCVIATSGTYPANRRPSTARRDDRGATLILALIFIVSIGLIVGALSDWAMNDLGNSTRFKSVNSLDNATTSAVELAMGIIRYHPLVGSTYNNVLYQANVYSFCWDPPNNGTVSLLATDGYTIDVYCSTNQNLTSSNTRYVDIYACQSSVSQTNCLPGQSSNPQWILHAQVLFDDYPTGNTITPLQSTCTTTCGQTATPLIWTWRGS